MEIYVEYAFLENFLFDGVLLSLALTAARVKRRWGRICLSATLGGAFALLFPLLRLPSLVEILLKLLVGAALVACSFGRLKRKKEWGRYALSVIFFFCFTFGFGGSLLGVYSEFSQGSVDAFTLEKPSAFAVLLAFLGLSILSVWLIRFLRRRKRITQNLLSCQVFNGEKGIKTDGFFDSGNLATKNGLPVCFLSPDLAYDLFGDDWGNSETDLKIFTMAGEKNFPLQRGEVEVSDGARKEKRQVYFATTANMIGREYKVLLHARLWGEDYEMDRTDEGFF